jgi:hypothetical protein
LHGESLDFSPSAYEQLVFHPAFVQNLQQTIAVKQNISKGSSIGTFGHPQGFIIFV